MQRYKDRSVHTRGQAGAGQVHPEPPAPTRRRRPHTVHETSTAECTCWGGAEPAWGQRDTGEAGLRLAGLHILVVLPSRWGQFPVGVGPMDLSCQSPLSWGLVAKAIALSPYPQWARGQK